MRNYIDISNHEKTSLFDRLHLKGVKLYNENDIDYLEFEGKSIIKPNHWNCEDAVKREFNISI